MKKKSNILTEEIGIIVEGRDDKMFISEICKKIELKNFQVEMVSERGGKTEFLGKENKFDISNIKALIDKTLDNPKKILLICDADFKETNKIYAGFQKTKSALNTVLSKLKKEYKNREVELFILPNNADDGNLDSLFLQCAEQQIVTKIKCVDDYLKCLGQELPINKKDKLYSQFLISAIGHQQDLKNVGGAVKISGYWDLDHVSLNPLKKFLKKFK